MGPVRQPLQLDRDKLEASFRGRSVALLPKEFALLDFLCRHESRSFSREQLLDAVWTMEAPVDRTVDDHIYRLRKKLALWETELGIETVRSVGYKFVYKKREASANPLLGLPAFNEDMCGVADTYLRYGRGDALLALYKNREMFGFDVDPGFGLLIRAMEGDVRFAVDPEAASLKDRAFLLLYLYQYLDPGGNRPFIEAALRDRTLPPVWQNELETMTIIHLLLEWEDYEEALLRLENRISEARERGWEGLFPYYANLRLAHALHAEGDEDRRLALQQAEEELRRYPYRREEGQFLLLKGLFVYSSDPAGGLANMEQGVAVLGQSQFVLHLLHGLHTILEFARQRGWDGVRRRFEGEWQRLIRSIGLDGIQDEMRCQLGEFFDEEAVL